MMSWFEDYRDTDTFGGNPGWQPPEYDEPEEAEYEGVVETYMESTVIVFEDGSIDFANSSDEYEPWMMDSSTRDGDWVDEEVGIVVADPYDVMEASLDLLQKAMAGKEPGTYKVEGDITLYYDIDEVYIYRNFYDYDDYEETIDTDSACVSHRQKDDTLGRFECTKIS